MSTIIKYKFRFENGHEKSFSVELNRPKPDVNSATEPEWTALEFHQCINCPLTPKNSPRCPVALDVKDLLKEFKDINSTERVKVLVEAEARSYFLDTDAQTGLRALLGLIMATSYCPILRQVKPMAHFHLPFATVEETLFRTTSAYLLQQYFKQARGEKADLKLIGLADFYNSLETVNYHFLERIRESSKQDANVNAVVSFSALSSLVKLSLEENLKELEELFKDS